MGAQHLTQQEKAALYEDMLKRYQILQEQVRQIKAKNFEVCYVQMSNLDMVNLSLVNIYGHK